MLRCRFPVRAWFVVATLVVACDQGRDATVVPQPAAQLAVQRLVVPPAAPQAPAPATAGSHRGASSGPASVVGGVSLAELALAPSRASAVAEPAFADPRSCVSCHEAQAFAHGRSDHGRAMLPASEASLLGDFDDARFEQQGRSARFFRSDGRFLVSAEDAAGTMTGFEVAYSFGVHPLQQLLLRRPGGRLAAFDLAWDTGRERWFALRPDDGAPPGDAFHWTGRYQTANAMCIECHSTGYRRGYDRRTDSYTSRWLETGVGCQACHGAGSTHLDWVAAGGPDGPAGNDPLAGFSIDPGGPGQVQLCARCHARREGVSNDPRPERPLLDDFAPAALRDGLYFADGQIRDEVFVYGSFVQSVMFRRGVRCGDCHEPHGLGLRAPGNALCTQCHNPYRGDPRFPELQLGLYDDVSHHHHRAGEAGSACVDCHMPARTYMVVDPRRDHAIRVPRPDLAARLGTPDACTGCHGDQSPAWAEQVVREWAARAGHQTVMGTPHYAEVLAAARQGRATREQLEQLASDEDVAPIVASTALQHLAELGTVASDAVARAAASDQPLLRLGAARAASALDPVSARDVALTLLADPLRAVRTEAVRWLAPLALESGAPEQLTPAVGDPIAPDADPLPAGTPGLTAAGASDQSVRALARAVLGEWLVAEQARFDLPEAPFRVALVAQALGDEQTTEADYRRALLIDPGFRPARFNLVQWLAARGREQEAEDLLREGMARAPEDGELHYALGLLLAQRAREPAKSGSSDSAAAEADGASASGERAPGEKELLEHAQRELGLAAELLPDRARVSYNHGLALYRLGHLARAEAALQRCLEIDPAERDALALLLRMALERGDRAVAREWALALQSLLPGSAALDDLIRSLEDGSASR